MSNEKSRILFYGTPYFAAKTLETMYTYGLNIAAVITQPDRSSGRGNLVAASAVKKTADRYHILTFQPTSKDELVGTIKQIKPDIAVVAAFGNILPEDVLGMPKFGSLNIHGSLLPKYRGPSPIATAILNGDAETGITIIRMTGKMDAGPIVSQAKIRIAANETTESLYVKLAQLSGEEISRVLPLYLNGEIAIRDQDDSKASYCSLIKKEDGRIDWSRRAGDIERTVRAFIPWPNAYSFWNDRMIKILEAKVSEKALDPGYVVAVGKNLLIGCGEDALEVVKLQMQDRNAMSAEEFLNGNRDIDGATLR
jgi:methionyl-tRNA formyltransferase